MYQLGSWSAQFFPSGDDKFSEVKSCIMKKRLHLMKCNGVKKCVFCNKDMLWRLYINTLLWLRHRIMAIGVEIPLYHLTGMELQPFKVIYATSTAINYCALRSHSISFLWGCRKLFANNTVIVIIQVWLYWGTKYTCTTLYNDLTLTLEIGFW